MLHQLNTSSLCLYVFLPFYIVRQHFTTEILKIKLLIFSSTWKCFKKTVFFNKRKWWWSCTNLWRILSKNKQILWYNAIFWYRYIFFHAISIDRKNLDKSIYHVLIWRENLHSQKGHIFNSIRANTFTLWHQSKTMPIFVFRSFFVMTMLHTPKYGDIFKCQRFTMYSYSQHIALAAEK